MVNHNESARTTERIGADRLLGIRDVSSKTGFSAATASRIISESKKGITLHRRRFILESNLLGYLRSLEEAQHADRPRRPVSSSAPSIPSPAEAAIVDACAQAYRDVAEEDDRHE